ncbi:MAG: hypothetical protein JST52_10040 [Bacteroidetes bacterium]|nr:hypothetical protein [Bacteroidota bacterium]MBS1741107.1 hypothetical protein [Bacteroidota bacterium]MBS1775128.1 hypothetical protein [Bacteroidota bacterium]
MDQASVKQPSKVLRFFANVFSYVFHPVFMPVAMFVLLYYLSPASFAGHTPEKFSLDVIQFLLNTVLFPVLVVVLLKALGFIESIKLHDTRDRIIPLIGTMIFYFWMNQVVKNLNYPLVVHVLTLGCFWGLIGVFMINIFFKISMHTAAAGGMLGIMMVLMLISKVNMLLPFFIAVVIAGLIGTARLILSAHRPPEIWLGYIVGFLAQMAAYWYL